jgi:CBS domain-containing protein
MSLTPKQHIFVQGILSGMNQSDAYREAYDVDGMLPATIHNEAFKLMNSHEISTSLKEAWDTKQGWTLARVVEEGERNLAGSREAQQWASANGALQFLGKVTGVVTERPVADSVSITRVTIVLDSGTSLSLDSNAATSLSEPSLEPSLEAGIEPEDTTASY